MLTVASENLLSAWAVAADVEELYGPAGSRFYDSTTRGDRSEVREIIRFVRRYHGDVLDLAAGSGRLTLPLLAMQRTVTALDSSPEMLEILRRRARSQSERGLILSKQDMTTFTLPGSFAVIVLGATSVTLLDRLDRAKLFARVRAHMEPGGRFLLSTTDTEGAEMASAFEGTLHTARGVPMPYYFSQEVDRSAGRRLVNFLVPPTRGSIDQAKVFTSIVNLLSSAQLASELQRAGFDVRSSTIVKANGAGSRGLVLLECS